MSRPYPAQQALRHPDRVKGEQGEGKGEDKREDKEESGKPFEEGGKPLESQKYLAQRVSIV
jgi:hypothetical protein